MKVRGVSDSFCREHVRSAKNTSGFSSVLLSELICVLYLAGKVPIGRSPCGLFEPSKDTAYSALATPSPRLRYFPRLGELRWEGAGRYSARGDKGTATGRACLLSRGTGWHSWSVSLPCAPSSLQGTTERLPDRASVGDGCPLLVCAQQREGLHRRPLQGLPGASALQLPRMALEVLSFGNHTYECVFFPATFAVILQFE